jgi:4-hydroxy-tetrahydrodipicolinate synthase
MSRLKTNFGSVITAMITPFLKTGNVDYSEACRLAVWLCAHGSDSILLAGTTGESPTLTHDEELTLFKEVKKAIGSKGKVIAGTGSNSTVTAVEATKKAEKAGVDGILQVVPYYNKPQQEGMYLHFKAVAENTSLPIILYNIPGRTGVNMLPETTARLAEIPNIIALKAACGNVEQIKKTRELCPKDFLIYSGDDILTLDILKVGGCGVISVASHIAGLEIKKMIGLYTNGDNPGAETLNTKLQSLFKVLFITTNPSPVKYACSLLGFKVGIPRLPLVEPTEEEKKKIKDVLVELKLVV